MKMDSKTPKLPTQFAPAERSDPSEIDRQVEIIKNQPLTARFLESIPVYVLILNQNRQIVYANSVFNNLVGAKDYAELIGKRSGEALHCIHSTETDGGCGTTEFCRMCGAIKATLASQKGNKAVQECRITLEGNKALDLLVWANQLELQNEKFTIFAFTDIGNEKRKRILEKLFFHDILNTAGGLRGYLELAAEDEITELDELIKFTLKLNDKLAENFPADKMLAVVSDLDELLGSTLKLSDKLIDEIHTQRIISAAENDELQLSVSAFSSLDILKDILLIFKHHEATTNKKLTISKSAADKIISTDKTLLRKVLVNLTKNALEASSPGQTVELSSVFNNGIISFTVQNPNIIPRDIQLQIFQRNFSTKGVDRGLGTYSVKLFTEKYLRGTINFISDEKIGTVFTADYPVEINL